MPPPKLASLSVDLDSLSHYCRIHGLPPTSLPSGAEHLVATVAIPRFLELFQRVDVAATFFVIGADAQTDSMQRSLKQAVAAKVELASHSNSHDYALSRWPLEAIVADLREAHACISAIQGSPVVGFRAPGYTLSKALLEAVSQLGYQYDSSAFPAAPYYLAKASVMAALALSGRPSQAILDSPAVLLAPRQPYHPSPSHPYRRGNSPVLELPLSVTPIARVPFFGTLATSVSTSLVGLGARTLAGDDFVNFEMHAIDVLDVSDGIPPALAARQRDALVSASTKMRRLEAVFSGLKAKRVVVSMREAATVLKQSIRHG